MNFTLPDWLNALDGKLVTVHLNGEFVGRGNLYLFDRDGQHRVDLWLCDLVIDRERTTLTLQGENTLCITAKPELIERDRLKREYREGKLQQRDLIQKLRLLDKVADIEDDEARLQACDDINLEVNHITIQKRHLYDHTH